MRRVSAVIGVLILLGALTVPGMSAEKGGCMSGLVGCLIGPRVGLELNEGKPVETTEWLRLVGIGALINDYEAYQKNGCTGCLLENFLGPRVGRQYDYRNARTLEWVSLVTLGIPNLIMAIEAYQGKTMTEIEASEHLRK